MQERTDLTVEDYKGTLNENPSSCKHRRILGQPQSQPHVLSDQTRYSSKLCEFSFQE